jgi:arylsulfatase
MQGSRAIICGPWKATTNHISHQAEHEERLMEGSRSFEADHWSLANLDTDFSEAHDLSEQHPEVVSLLERLWYAEAQRNHVLPMFESLVAVAAPDGKTAVRAEYRPEGGVVAERSLPSFVKGGKITAAVEVPPGGGQGVLCAVGDWNSGLALYVQEGRLVFALNVGGDAFELVAEEPVPTSHQELACRLAPRDGNLRDSASGEDRRHRAPMSGGGTVVTLLYGNRTVGSARTELPIPGKWGNNPTAFRLGADNGLPISKGYTPPYPWTGIIYSIRVETGDEGI